MAGLCMCEVGCGRVEWDVWAVWEGGWRRRGRCWGWAGDGAGMGPGRGLGLWVVVWEWGVGGVG